MENATQNRRLLVLVLDKRQLTGLTEPLEKIKDRSNHVGASIKTGQVEVLLVILWRGRTVVMVNISGPRMKL